MKITVTEQHIKNGKRGDLCECPIALAVKDRFPGYDVFVGMRRYIWQEREFPCISINGTTDFRISANVVNQALAFDSGEEIQPFSFRLMSWR